MTNIQLPQASTSRGVPVAAPVEGAGEHTIIDMARAGVAGEVRSSLSSEFSSIGANTPARGQPVAEALEITSDIGRESGECGLACGQLFCALLSMGIGFGTFLGLSAASMKILCGHTSFCDSFFHN